MPVTTGAAQRSLDVLYQSLMRESDPGGYYRGEVRWANPPQEQVQAETPYPTSVAGSFAREGMHDTEESRLGEFRRAVRRARDEDSDLGYSGREYVRGLTNGELENAAKAYEHLRPELWPFNGSRRFDALERSEWNRMARAVAFLTLEKWRLGDQYRADEPYEADRDLEQEIRRLEFKAIDLRWPRRSVQEDAEPGYVSVGRSSTYVDTPIDPF